MGLDWANRCALCRGTKMLCGKSRCPVLVRYFSFKKNLQSVDRKTLEGSSPPGVFIGRYGYPKVQIGPLAPPTHGDTSLLDTPEKWLGKGIEEIVDFRSQLVRGKVAVDVKNVDATGMVEKTRELAMAKRPADVDVHFSRRPQGKIRFSSNVQPLGPSAPLRDLELGNIRWNQRIEKAYSDADLKAAPAVIRLHDKDVLVSKIQKAFSVGAFGVRKDRKFVPTRWSITAVDDTIGKELVKEVKDYPPINEYRVYESYQLDNRWIVLMMPKPWSYELIEAWYPKTTWNPVGKKVSILSSAEFWEGRKKYAEIGGCYYAARLAVGEHLRKERRQASVVIMREAHPGYIMPVGVWNVRETVRDALKKPCRKFRSLEEALDYSSTKLDIGKDIWMRNSEVLKDLKHQKRLEDFV